MFLHVPGGEEEEDLVHGGRVVVALIRALAEGWGSRENVGVKVGGENPHVFSGEKLQR